MNAAIVMYHYVRDLKASRYPEIKGLDLALFRQQIDYLGQHGTFVSMAQIVNAGRGGKALPKNAVLLTFDDGYIDHYTNVFPILSAKGIPAFFSMPGRILAEQKVLDVNKVHFILASTPIERLLPKVYASLDAHRQDGFDYPDNQALYAKLAVANRFDGPEVIFVKRLLQVELPEALRARITDELFLESVGMDEAAFAKELYMSRDQVALMHAAGMEWGLHGYDHYWMNRLSEMELSRDIDRARAVFEGIVPERDWVFGYPYGSHSEDVIRVAMAHGCGAGLASTFGVAAVDEANLFTLSRFDANDFPPKSERFLDAMKWA